MFHKMWRSYFTILHKDRNSSKCVRNCIKHINTSVVCLSNGKKEAKEVAPKGLFENLQNKNRDTYIETIKIFVNRDAIYRRGHVDFIYSALKNMEEFGVQKDLKVYKALIDVLPKGKFIPQNIIQAEFMHYPKQQQCIIDLLEQMEDNGVMPDYEMEDMLLNIFGKKGFPLRKFWRMMYWMPKFKNLSPWPVPNPPPDDMLDLAKLAIDRISSIDAQSKTTIYHANDITDSIDHTWIVSAQSTKQKMLLQEYNEKDPVYVEGGFKVWLRSKSVNYFVLRGKPKPIKEDNEDNDNVSGLEVPYFGLKPPVKKSLSLNTSQHEQEDGIIFSVCATGTSSKDSLLSWIRHLEKDNPKLATIPIVFTLKQMPGDVTVTEETDS
ncbi:unnamed protein product [Brassicogethes aeneus]|uniref:Evolutionarily conserved signaling intermediate in Toll pathway, mitochondrial n=1 Tax=Brassicogethes aeneus TaxID=1431903 RepID=A0A9P0FLS2_BRAAE|nr:unnamed protein product [Brassicogethes aeneus]